MMKSTTGKYKCKIKLMPICIQTTLKKSFIWSISNAFSFYSYRRRLQQMQVSGNPSFKQFFLADHFT